MLFSPAAALAAPARTLSDVVLANIGPGYTVVSQGPLNRGEFASSSPDPSAAAAALNSLAKSIDTYQRVWQDGSTRNQVQDLVVHFSSTQAAQAFLTAARHSLTKADIVSSNPLPEIRGATRTTYFATTTQVGVGQTITMRSGPYVVLLSTFSADAANPQAITESDAASIAVAQHKAVDTANSHARTAAPNRPPRSSFGSVGLVVAIVIVASLLFWVRRRMSEVSDMSQPPGPKRV
jgi:hypothetical protein